MWDVTWRNVLLFNAGKVPRQPQYAVRVVPREIRVDQTVGHNTGLIFGSTAGYKERPGQFAQMFSMYYWHSGQIQFLRGSLHTTLLAQEIRRVVSTAGVARR